MKKILFITAVFSQFMFKSQTLTTFIKAIDTPSSLNFPYGIVGGGITFDNSDKTFIINGNSNTTNYSTPAITKIDTNGNVIWMSKITTTLGTKVLVDGFIQNNKYKAILKDNFNSFSNVNHLSSIYSVNTNSTFNSVTQRYGGVLGINDGDAHLQSIKLLPNGNKIACGYIACYTCSGNSKANWFTKLDQNDSVVWSRHLASPSGFSNFIDCDYSPFNQYYFTGQTHVFNGFSNIVVIKTDTMGNKLWEYNFDNNFKPEYGSSCKAMPDGGVTVFGGYEGYWSGSQYVYEIIGMRLDSAGNTMWSKIYYGSGSKSISNHGINILPNGNLLITGNIDIYSGLLMIVNPTTGGLISSNNYWSGIVSGNGWTSFSKSVIRGNNIYTSGGTSTLNNGINSLFLMKTDLSTNFIGTSCSKVTTNLLDSNYNVSKFFFNNANNLQYISKSPTITYSQSALTNSLNTICTGTASITSINDFEGNSTELIIFPNPTTNQLYISSQAIISKAEVLNNIGQKILSKNNINATKTSIDLNMLPVGIYFVQLQTNEGTVTKKIIKE